MLVLPHTPMLLPPTAQRRPEGFCVNKFDFSLSGAIATSPLSSALQALVWNVGQYPITLPGIYILPQWGNWCMVERCAYIDPILLPIH